MSIRSQAKLNRRAMPPAWLRSAGHSAPVNGAQLSAPDWTPAFAGKQQRNSRTMHD